MAFVGTISGSTVQITGSVLMGNDLAVNGGDITSTAGTFNIASVTNITNLYGSSVLLGATGNINLSGSATTINAGSSGLSFQRDGSTYSTLTGDATSISIGATPSRVTANFFVGNVTTLNVGSAITTSIFNGKTTLATVTEKLSALASSTGTVSFDMTNQGIFYVNNPAGDITANFTNVPTTNNRVITPTVILSQSATPRMVSAVQIDTVAQTINWANGTTPSGTANKQDVFGFSLIRSGSAWKVLGQLSTYG